MVHYIIISYVLRYRNLSVSHAVFRGSSAKIKKVLKLREGGGD